VGVVPLNADEQLEGTEGQEVEFIEMEPQQYCPAEFWHVVRSLLHLQVTG
jgi:hypothetical protein